MSEKKKAGRPTKKTDARLEIILEAIENHGHIEIACGLAQIDTKTFYNWKNSDPDFSVQVAYAKARCVQRLSGTLQKADPWKILKNVAPKLYKDKIEQEVSGPQGGPLKLIVEDYRSGGDDA